MFELQPLMFNLLRHYRCWNIRRKLGLVVRCSYSENYRFSYFCNDTPRSTTSPPLLLLHCFAGNKDSWLPFIKHLPRNQHVVALDIPGHGDTSRPGSEENVLDYTIRINQFVQSIGLDKRPFHLAGHSLGGDIAGLYAVRYPTQLSTLTLISPPGIQGSEYSGIIVYVKKLQNQNVNPMILVPTTVEEFETVFRFTFNAQMNIPRSVIKGMLAERSRYNDFYKELYTNTVQSPYILHEHLPLIKTPVHVIWGKNDRLAHVSGAAAVQKVLPNCQVSLLDNCGHAVCTEQPKKCANLVMDFLTAHEVDRKNTQKDSFTNGKKESTGEK